MAEIERSYDHHRHPLREEGRRRFFRDYLKQELADWCESPGRILILGGGDGVEAEFLKAHFPTAQVVSLDLAWKEIELGRDRTGAGSILQGDWERPPFRSGAFDLITMFAALHHSANLTLTLTRISQILSPGGCLLATHEPMASLLTGWRQRSHMRSIGQAEAGIETSPYPWEYSQAASRAGFSKVNIGPSSLNRVRLVDMEPCFEDVAIRRSPWPEELMAAMLRRMPVRLQKPITWWIQRLCFGLFGITIRALNPTHVD